MSNDAHISATHEATADTRDAAYFATLLGDWSKGDGPLYSRLATALVEAVMWRRLQVGDAVPAERQLAQTLNVARSTVIRTYEVLREQGILESRRGSGSWVAASAESLALERKILDGLSNAAPSSDHSTIDLATASFGADQAVLYQILRQDEKSLWPLLDSPGYAVAGDWNLREAVAKQLSDEGLSTTPEQVLITTGAQQSISLIVRRFVESGDVVVVEDPTSAGALDLLSEARANVRAAIGDAAHFSQDVINIIRRARPTLVLLATPGGVHGAVIPLEALQDVAAAVETSQCLVVEDASARDLARTACPPYLAALTSAPVLTLGSMSKLYWGGLRIGWIRGTENLIEGLTRTKARADLGTSMLSQHIAIGLLPLRDDIRARRIAHIDANIAEAHRILRAGIPDLEWQEPEAGLAIWARLPHGTSSRLVNRALDFGVRVTGGESFSFSGRSGDHVRISLAPPTRVFTAGLERLVAAWASVEQSADSPNRGSHQSAVPYINRGDGLI